MPNIEIHGYYLNREEVPSDCRWERDNCERLKEAIFELFTQKPYLADIVVTVVRDGTESHYGGRRPFLRVVTIPEPYLDEVIQALKAGTAMEIEVLMLHSFHPK